MPQLLLLRFCLIQCAQPSSGALLRIKLEYDIVLVGRIISFPIPPLLERPSISGMVDRRAVRKPVEWR